MSVFISYSRQDKEFVSQLAFGLIQHRARIWMDVSELKAGDSLIDKIQAALESASVVVVVLSKAFVASEWCKQELSSGLIRELEEKRVVVIPVLKEECEIPLFLRRKMYADFRNDFEHGLKEVLDALASSTSEGLGRIEQGSFHTDWSVDWFYEHDLFNLRITLIDHHEQQPYSGLTEINVRLNEAATARQRRYDDNELGWFGRFNLIERITEPSDRDDMFLLLEDQFPKVLRFAIQDTKSPAVIKVEVRSRRVGDDNGKDILVNVASQLGAIRQAQRERVRPATKEELERIAVILSQLG